MYEGISRNLSGVAESNVECPIVICSAGPNFWRTSMCASSEDPGIVWKSVTVVPIEHKSQNPKVIWSKVLDIRAIAKPFYNLVSIMKPKDGK